MTRAFLCLLALLALAAQPATAGEPDPAGPAAVQLQVFVRAGCPHCDAAKAFLPTLQEMRPWLQTVYRPVDTDAVARADLLRYSRQAGLWPPGVPTFVIDDRVLLGFADAATSGPALAALVDAQRPLQTAIDTRLFGRLDTGRLGLPLFTVVIGLIDGFNPCAMWVLLFLLALLVHLQDRRRMVLVAGTFVLASGLVYYAFLAAWLNLFLLTGFSTGIRLGLGSLAVLVGLFNARDALRPGQGFLLSIPSAAKPGLYARMRAVLRAEHLLPALLGVSILAVLVNSVELLCTAGLPALYTAILSQQDIGQVSHYAYLGLYILAYITDDALMVAVAVLALDKRRLGPRGGRRLKLLSALVMLSLGGILLLHPEWLL